MTHTYLIPNVPGYEISQDGRVYSMNYNWRGCGNREMKQHPNADGYPSVRLTVDGSRKRYKVHRLVAITFLGECPNDCDQTRHLDGNKLNNNHENIAWGTAKDNAIDRENHRRTSRGESHSITIKNGFRRKQ